MKKILVLILLLFFISCTREGFLEITNSTGGDLDLKIESEDYPLKNGECAEKIYEFKGGLFSSEHSYYEINISGKGDWKNEFQDSVIIYKKETTTTNILADPIKRATFTITDTKINGYVEIYYSVKNTGNVDIDYYKVWFKVTCIDNSTYTEWDNGTGVNVGKELSDWTIIDIAGKTYLKVEITDYGFDL